MTNEDLYAAILSLQGATEVYRSRVEERFNGVDNKLDRIDSRLGRIESRVEVLEDGQTAIRADIAKLKSSRR